MSLVFTNKHKVSLALAVWLVDDTYDYVAEDRYLSVTGLMRPIRQIILPPRVKDTFKIPPDVTDRIASAMGTSLHDSIEKAWVNRHKENLAKLGMKDEDINRIVINPTPLDFKTKPDLIPVYIEQRSFKTVDGWTIGGKFDMITNGVLQDNKSTSVYTYMQDNRSEDYILQGSLYRWLNPDKVTQDFIRINFLFTDWSRGDAKRIPGYPEHRVMHKEYKLWSIAKTEEWVRAKLSNVIRYMNAPEHEIPHCTDEELWLPKPKWKYYSDPAKADGGRGRSSRTFTDKAEAMQYFSAKKGQGLLLPIVGLPKRCDYCDAFPLCTQKDLYQDD